MNYFTRELYLALQRPDDESARRADADWEAAVDHYDAYLGSIRAELPESVRQLLDGFHLHDATVLSMGQRGNRFAVTLRLDVPPNEILTIAYNLQGSPVACKECFPWVGDNDLPPRWLYEELELVGAGDGRHYVHRILFENGWELELPFRDVALSTLYPVFPLPRTPESALAAPVA